MNVLLVGEDADGKARLKSFLEGLGLSATDAEWVPKVPGEPKISDPRLIVADLGKHAEAAIHTCRKLVDEAAPGSVFSIAVADDGWDFPAVQTRDPLPVDHIVFHPRIEEELAFAVHAGLRILSLEARLRAAEEKIRSLSVADPLTGAYTRQYLLEHLDHEIKRAVRYGRSLSVAVCGIDRLDAINSVWGIGMGDRVLAGVSRLLRGSVRKNIDWVARENGDGFVVVLPETDVDGAHSLAERLRHRINDGLWDEEGADIRLTVSFGLSGFLGRWNSAPVVDAKGLIESATRCLKESQRQGLNQIAGKSIG